MWLGLNYRHCPLLNVIPLALRRSFHTALNRNLLELFSSFSLLSCPGWLFRFFTRYLENNLPIVLISISAANRIANILVKRTLTVRLYVVLLNQGLAVVGFEIVVDFLLQMSFRPLKQVLVLLNLLLKQDAWLAFLAQLLKHFLRISLLVSAL